MFICLSSKILIPTIHKYKVKSQLPLEAEREARRQSSLVLRPTRHLDHAGSSSYCVLLDSKAVTGAL